MKNTYRVYNQRDGTTLYLGSKIECIRYMNDNFCDRDEVFGYVWMEEYKELDMKQ